MRSLVCPSPGRGRETCAPWLMERQRVSLAECLDAVDADLVVCVSGQWTLCVVVESRRTMAAATSTEQKAERREEHTEERGRSMSSCVSWLPSNTWPRPSPFPAPLRSLSSRHTQFQSHTASREQLNKPHTYVLIHSYLLRHASTWDHRAHVDSERRGGGLCRRRRN